MKTSAVLNVTQENSKSSLLSVSKFLFVMMNTCDSMETYSYNFGVTMRFEPKTVPHDDMTANSALSLTPEMEERIYNKYRFVLKSVTKENRFERASARRQFAREAVVKQFNLYHAAVKDIVKKHDELNGVTHEHNPDYLAGIRFHEEADRLLAENTEGKCSHCGWHPVDGDVEFNGQVLTSEDNEIRIRVNPLKTGNTRDFNPMLSCFMCYLSAKRDI